MKKLSIYVPLADKLVGGIVVDVIARRMTKLYGGATVSACRDGYWADKMGMVAYEPVVVVYTLVPDADHAPAWQWLRQQATELKDSLAQESVLITMEDVEAEFI